jgi:hypothetical protein
MSQTGSYQSVSYPQNLSSIDEKLQNLFNNLMYSLYPMDKAGAMSGRCEVQTSQMERFLTKNFHFENIPGEYIVHGVKSFKVGQYPSSDSFEKNVQIKFPSEEDENPFVMTIEEILEWQKSFVVYFDNQNDLSFNKDFIKLALQGQSEQGDEAFRMKFVIRISSSPILMEFDGKIIPRSLTEEWPNKIKLVSVTGVDFAGRIHDIKDILTYIKNWRDVYMIDPQTNLPFVYNGRDFAAKQNVPAELDEESLFKDLIRMVRLRLYACNKENIEIVVETGIGLGVFAGKQIGIDHQTRLLSAKAVKYVLENDGSSYSSIRAIIFALPIFEQDQSTSTFNYFVQTFNENYSGSIPVLIVDQDMHRLTVAIAKKDFSVSQLNPADSHGVFGEYWQNHGPAVEEKLALTTLGLLIQHHIFNVDHVLNINNYKYVDIPQYQTENTIISIPNNDLNVIHSSQTSPHTIMWIYQGILWFIFTVLLGRK